MNSADTAWLLVSAALVMLITPGVALFYGGMVRKKNILSTMMMSFAATWGLGKLVDITIGLRVSQTEEAVGLDLSQHGKKAYGGVFR